MNRSMLMLALLAVLSLGACERTTVVEPPATPAAVPGPAGPQGETGDPGKKGETGDPGRRDDIGDPGTRDDTGKAGDGPTVIETPPAEPAPAPEPAR
jgi:hypothetical protein